jgi:hypothetical protein
MEEYINVDHKNILQQIRQLSPSLQYAACAKFMDLMRPYFCKFTIDPDKKLFYRVRPHSRGVGKYFYNNISELTYRSDFFNITNFGRCNCPYESIFYCSDSAFLALMEVSEKYRKESNKDALYHTLSIWRMKETLNVTPIFDQTEESNSNRSLKGITNKCYEIIDKFGDYSKKEQLKEFHNIIGKEFVRPFSTEGNIYFFSSAVSGYLLSKKFIRSETIDALVYPTCLGNDIAQNIGLNYAFDPTAVGFGRKIEFAGAYRSKMEKKGNAYYETERIKF